MRISAICLGVIAFGGAVAFAQTDDRGFIQGWLLLGPYSRDGGANPPPEVLSADYLTDGVLLEEIVAPRAGDTIATDYGIAASTGYLGQGIPTWKAWTDQGSGINLNDDVYGPSLGDPNGCMAYACAYVENMTGRDQSVVAAMASDDSIEVLAGPETIFTLSESRPWGAPGEVQNRCPFNLRAGKNRLLVKCFEGTGEWGFRLRLETADGAAITDATPGYRFSLEPSGVTFPALVLRSLPDVAPRGVPIEVTLDVRLLDRTAPAIVDEVIPEGWTLGSVGSGGQVTGRSIRWTVAEPRLLSYFVTNESESGGNWSGTYRWKAREFATGGESVAAGDAVDRSGWIRHWLILGPLGRAGGAAPGATALGADYLTDGGRTWEQTILPVAGGIVAPDFCGAAAASGIAPNELGSDRAEWRDHIDADDTVCLEGSAEAGQEWHFDPEKLLAVDDFVAFAAVYVDNLGAEPRSVSIGLASDDSVAVYVNTRIVFARSIARAYGAAGAIQDVAGGVQLAPGRNRILVKIFEGGGVSGFRLRLQDECGRPAFLPIAVAPGSLSFPVRVARRLPLQTLGGEIARVALDVSVLGSPAPSSLAVTEWVPPSWTIVDAGGGSADGNEIAWRLAPVTDRTLEYRVQVPERWWEGTFAGTWAAGSGPAYEVGGEGAVAGGAPAGFGPGGFITDWLILGPYSLDQCGSIAGQCGGAAQPPCCSAPGLDRMLADYLTDGALVEELVEPYPGMPIETDYRIAAGTGLRQVPRQDINSGGTPRWFHWHSDDGFVDLNEEVFGGGNPEGCMAYAAAYVHNDTGAPLEAYLALGSDDSPVVRLNGTAVHAANIAPSGRAYGGPPAYQDVAGPVTLEPGQNRLLVKIFEGWGSWSFALRFQDSSSQPIARGLRVELTPEAGGTFVRRTLPPAAGSNETVSVELEVHVRARDRIAIVEEVPAAWGVVDAGGGAVTGNRIRWDGVASTRTILYRLLSDSGVIDGAFAGTVSGSVAAEVAGETSLPRRVTSSPAGAWSVATVGGAWGAAEQLSAGAFNVWARGNDIWANQDQFTYVYQPARGAFTLVAYVDSQRPSHAWAKAGLMARFGTCSDAGYFLACVTPDWGVDWQYRLEPGHDAQSAGPDIEAGVPRYLLLSASPGEGKILGASSADGVRFSTHGVADLPADGGELLVGLATSSHHAEVSGAASYREVELVDRAMFPPQDLMCTYTGRCVLRWRNPMPMPYDSIAIERHGAGGKELLATLGGAATTFTDTEARGSIVYRVVAAMGGIALAAECGVNAGAPYRVNCGGGTYVDVRGRGWIPDIPFVAAIGSTNIGTSANPVANAEDDVLMQSERWLGQSNGAMEYGFDVARGSYTVELYFVELCTACTSPFGPDGIPDTADDGGFGRTFDVLLEGRPFLEGFQPAVVASREFGRGLPGGEPFIAVVRSTTLPVDDGTLNIRFVDLGEGNPPENPSISAIAVFPPIPEVPLFIGDVNRDGRVDIADAISLLSYLFGRDKLLKCMKAADGNNDQTLNIADAITVLSYLFAMKPLLDPEGAALWPAANGCVPYPADRIDPLGCANPCEGP